MDEAQGAQPQAGGISQEIANVHTGLLKIQEALAQKFPEDGQKLAQVIQAYQSVVDGLGQAPGQEKAAPSSGVTTPEVGAANVQQSL